MWWFYKLVVCLHKLTADNWLHSWVPGRAPKKEQLVARRGVLVAKGYRATVNVQPCCYLSVFCTSLTTSMLKTVLVRLRAFSSSVKVTGLNSKLVYALPNISTEVLEDQQSPGWPSTPHWCQASPYWDHLLNSIRLDSEFSHVLP